MTMKKEGDRVPAISWPVRVRDDSINGPNPFRWDTLDDLDVFAGRRVVVFSLPGAFTPTCSTFQVPGFESNYNTIRDMGIDEIYCVSVNDSFVMNKWAKDQCVERIKMIPDGNGDFTVSMGMLCEKFNLGFGKRSWRYAMVVNDGVIEKMFVEPGFEDNCTTDPYGETSPEAVIEYLKSVDN
jgi:peroxiredoxin